MNEWEKKKKYIDSTSVSYDLTKKYDEHAHSVHLDTHTHTHINCMAVESQINHLAFLQALRDKLDVEISKTHNSSLNVCLLCTDCTPLEGASFAIPFSCNIFFLLLHLNFASSANLFHVTFSLTRSTV